MGARRPLNRLFVARKGGLPRGFEDAPNALEDDLSLGRAIVHPPFARQQPVPVDLQDPGEADDLFCLRLSRGFLVEPLTDRGLTYIESSS